MTMRAVACGVVAVMTMAGVAPNAARPKFYDDDPIARETDAASAAAVQPFDLHLAWDLIDSLFGSPGDRTDRRALDLSTIDEVPDSSWFTNRVGSLPLTAADVERGPDTTNGPAPGTWTIVDGKSDGIRPGFTIVDSAHIKWYLKFDPPGHPELATGAEAVSTKLFWALGYNVAEVHVATLFRDRLALSREATIREGEEARTGG